MAFGSQNIEEILLSIRAEGTGEVDKVKQAMQELRNTAEGMLGKLAEGGNAQDLLKIFRDVGTINRQLGEMEKYLAAIGESEVAAAKAAAKERAEIAKQERIEREINLRQAAAAVKSALKEETQAAKAASKEQVDAEKASRAERAAALKEQRAQEKAALKEQADLERQERIEREANLKQEAASKAAIEKANLERLKRALAERTRAEKETQVELEKNLNKENDRLERQNRAMEQGVGAANKFGYGLLHIAHAIQDAQFGFGAVLNNIPLVVQALGGGPGLAGTVMVAGVGISVFGDKLQQLGREAGLLQDPVRRGAATIEQMKDVIAALVEKPWKIEIDFRSIERAKQELDELEARQKALEAAEKDRTSMQERVGKGVKEAFTELAGFGDQVGGTLNMERIVDVLAEESGMVSQQAALDPRQRELAMLRGRAAAKPMPGASGPEAMLATANAAQAAREAADLEAKIREDARVGIRRDLAGGAVIGNDESLGRLLNLIGTPRGQQLMRQGDPERDIRPVDPRLMQTLRESTKAGIEFADETEEWIQQVETAFQESITRVKALGKKERAEAKQEASQEVASLVADKKKDLEDSLGEDVLKLIGLGADRNRIANVLTGKTRAALGVGGPAGDEAADRILRQVIEKAFSGVMGMKASRPGMDDAQAAAALREAGAAKDAAKGAKVARDPVTGRPLSEGQKAELKALDEQVRDNIDPKQIGKAQEAQRLANATRFAMQNFNLNEGQAGVVAKRALQMEDQGIPPQMAAQRALQELGNRNQRMFNPRQRRRGQGAGFRSIAPIDPVNDQGGGGGNGGGLPVAATLAAVGAGVAGLTQIQQMAAASLNQTRQQMAMVVAQQRAMRQQQPSLLRAPMPMMPR